MSGISFPDRQGVCNGCGRVLTKADPHSSSPTIVCPGGDCDGVATVEQFIADHFVFVKVGF